MDRSEWENILCYFQASARGYLVRNAVRSAREDFERIVKEIDGSLSRVEWKGTISPAPHFSDTDSLFLLPSSSAKTLSNLRLDVPASPKSPSASSPSSATTPAAPCLFEEKGDRPALLEKLEADKDDSQTKGQASVVSEDHFYSRNVKGDEDSQIDISKMACKDRGLMKSTGDSANSAWSSLELDMSYSPPIKGPRQYCLAQDVPRTSEALRLHRNTLTMELLWLQQAIGSRKKYLSLKDRLSVS